MAPRRPPRSFTDDPGAHYPVPGVFVDATGLVYCTDYNAGLYIIEYSG